MPHELAGTPIEPGVRNANGHAFVDLQTRDHMIHLDEDFDEHGVPLIAYS